jgi:hypothetical protein
VRQQEAPTLGLVEEVTTEEVLDENEAVPDSDPA